MGAGAPPCDGGALAVCGTAAAASNPLAMLLTLTSTHENATDLGYLLRKNPARVQAFDLSFGKAHVFYPEATAERCTAALLVEVDPVALVRGRATSTGEGGALEQYVNDRPYAPSSFLSVAIAGVFGSALSGQCKEKPELAGLPLPLRVELPAVPCRGGEGFLRRLFEPLGYEVTAQRLMLDDRFPGWGDSRYYQVSLVACLPVHLLLSHLYVLIPVLDDEKHYWVGDDEVEKLLRRGEGWLSAHPERDAITRRYLKHRRSLAEEALTRLVAADESGPETAESVPELMEEAAERGPSLNEQRLGAVLAALKSSGAQCVLDLGCGEGRLLSLLMKDRLFTSILGMDVSCRSLQVARDRLHYDRLPPEQQARLRLIHGSLSYRDDRLTGRDAAAVVEVIEHLDAPRLASFERVVFEFARPGCVVVTTPNSEYNVKWESLPAGRFRHRDHRFEWTRAEFAAWAEGVAVRFGYGVRFLPVGPEDSALGAPTQMAIFSR